MKPGFKSKRTIIATFIALVIALAVYVNFNRISVYYRYVFIGNDLKPGDELYLSKKLFCPEKAGRYASYCLMRPLTDQEIDDKIFISDNKKAELKKLAKSTPEIFAIATDNGFVLKKMRQNGSMLLGTFIEKRLLTTKGLNDEFYMDVFYAIKPSGKIFTDAYGPVYEECCKLANDVVYVDSRAIDNDPK